jgi:hypothetical protein
MHDLRIGAKCVIKSLKNKLILCLASDVESKEESYCEEDDDD